MKKAFLLIWLLLFLTAALLTGTNGQVIPPTYAFRSEYLEDEINRDTNIDVMITNITLNNRRGIHGRCCRASARNSCDMDTCSFFIRTTCSSAPRSTNSNSFEIRFGQRLTSGFNTNYGTDWCFVLAESSMRIEVVGSETDDVHFSYTLSGLFPNTRVSLTNTESQLELDSSASVHIGILCDNRMGSSCSTLCFITSRNTHCDYRTGRKLCLPGFTGSDCQTDEGNPCVQNPCLNNGICIRMSGFIFQCVCPNSYTGNNCEISKCNITTCNHGICIDGNSICHCVDGYGGVGCEDQICDSGAVHVPCANLGVCYLANNIRKCSCDQARFAGNRCEYSCRERCQNGGTCIVDNEIPSCLCIAELFTGEFCQISIVQEQCDVSQNRCMNNPLDCRVNVATGEIRCICSQNWTGPRCEVSRCNRSTCINGVCILGAGCACEPNFVGENCDTPICTEDSCPIAGVCLVGINVQVCACDLSRTGRQCQFQCEFDCGFNGQCGINKDGTIRCFCKDGFYGERCRSNREQIQCTLLDCQNNSFCRLVGDRYRCVCSEGYEGVHCERTVCNLNNCINGNCLAGNGCYCLPGSTGDTCEINLCEINSCFNFGICQIINNYRFCLCQNGFTGRRCEIQCLNNCIFGRCTKHGTEFKCICQEGYSGAACDVKNRIKEVNSIMFVVVLSLIFILVVAIVTAVLAKHIFNPKIRKMLFDQVTITKSLNFNQPIVNKHTTSDLNWAALSRDK